MNTFSKQFFSVLVSLFLILFIGCANDAENKDNNDVLIENNSQENDLTEPSTFNSVTKIFYSLPTPVEMLNLVKQSNTSYYPELLSPTENADQYTTTASVAVNLGIYGVDLAYLKLFDQVQKSLTYLSVISKLSDKLGLPNENVLEVFNSLEKNTDDKEFQLNIISETYESSSKYLKDSHRDNIATLIILGGWIEGLYIATGIYEKDNNNKEILLRIAEQKYSLNTLISLVNKDEDETFSNFFSSLWLLKKEFDKIAIDFEGSNPEFDYENKVITHDGKNSVQITDEQINEITKIVKLLRAEFIK
jgi:hypothetical protein